MTLRAESISWGFQDGAGVRQIFDGLDVAFEPGRSYAVTGPSGCGKTTLLSILSLLCPPTSGRVLFSGQDLSSLSGAQAERFRRDRIGLIFQTFRLLEHLTVREHLDFAAGIKRRPECLGEGYRLIEALGLERTLDLLPRQLSGGEKQRVALTQALMFAPRILLADEPTAALDSENSAVVAAILAEYAASGDAVVVAVSHDAELIGRCSETLSLAEHVRSEASTALVGRADPPRDATTP